MMKPTLKDDLAFGTKNEETVWKQIEGMTGCSLSRLGGYSPLDYTNEAKTVWVELKTRRIKHDAYPTALIGANKVEFCKTPNASYYFVFSYNDGLWYIKYDKELFDSFHLEDGFERSWRPDASNAPQRIVHIPVNHLSKI